MSLVGKNIFILTNTNSTHQPQGEHIVPAVPVGKGFIVLKFYSSYT